VSELLAINDHEFPGERDNAHLQSPPQAPTRKIYKIDLTPATDVQELKVFLPAPCPSA
jgi:hypothetical protein